MVAAENFWGSIASQLAGTKADLRSIIVNPAQVRTHMSRRALTLARSRPRSS